jgi:hypothetical protein
LSSIPQPVQVCAVVGVPAQSAQVLASGPGGATSRRTAPQAAQVPRRRSAPV